MKKRSVVTILIVLLIIQLILIPAQAPEEFQEDPTVKKILEGTEKAKEFSEQENKEDYLAKEWTEFFQANKATSWIYKLNPAFKFLFAQEFSLSWAFVTALLIWIILLSIFFPLLRSVFNGILFPLLISIILTSITAQFVMPKLIEQLSNIVKNIWWNLGTIILLILIIILLGGFSRQITKALKQLIQKRKLKTLESEAKKSKATRQGIESIQEDAEAFKEGSKN